MENRFQILTQTLQIQMKRFNWIISISRPRFWSYLAGPWAVGMVSAANSIYDFQNIMINSFKRIFNAEFYDDGGSGKYFTINNKNRELEILNI